MDRRAWWTTVYGVARSQTRRSTHTHTHTCALALWVLCWNKEEGNMDKTFLVQGTSWEWVKALWRSTFPSSLATHKNSIMAVLFLRQFCFLWFGCVLCTCHCPVPIYDSFLFQFPWSFYSTCCGFQHPLSRTQQRLTWVWLMNKAVDLNHCLEPDVNQLSGAEGRWIQLPCPWGCACHLSWLWTTLGSSVNVGNRWSSFLNKMLSWVTRVL